MQVGIDSFAAAFDENSRALNPADRLRQLVREPELRPLQGRVGRLRQLEPPPHEHVDEWRPELDGGGGADPMPPS